MDQLFAVAASDVGATNNDWFTPRWIFDAAGLTFDLDVCAPIAPEFRTCPARRYLTVLDDGLAQPWEGTIWMNPPFSGPEAWVDKFVEHGSGLALIQAMKRAHYRGRLQRASDALAIIDVQFGRPDGSKGDIPWPLLIAARGRVCVEALARIAAADKYAGGAYHVRPG
jgi:DNA N-6-adenine-methyltransferase (Dam)